MRRLPLPAIALLPVLSVLACTSREDQLAKERIFSPEEPAIEVRRAEEKIPVADLATDPAVWARVWKMDRAEATRRLGAHKATTRVQSRWTRAGRTVALAEESAFETDADGHFRLTHTNDQDAGLEFVWADGRAFARSRYGPFRPRRIDRAQQDAWRDEGTGALRTVYHLFDRRLRASPLGPAKHAGRSVQRYALVLGEPWGEPEPAADVPPPSFGLARAASRDELVPGPDEDTARRLEFDTRRVPESVKGEILVDEQTAVILKGTVQARFKVPGIAQEPEAQLALDVAFDTKPDAKIAVKAPENVAEPKMPHAVNEPLWFLDGGSTPSTAEPADDEPDAPDEGAQP